MIDLEAIRARNRKRGACDDAGINPTNQHCDGCGFGEGVRSYDDINALLAEVERLQAAINSQNDRIQQLSYAAYPPNPSGE